MRENPVEKLFWGRVPVHQACSMFSYAGDKVKQMIRNLKYGGQYEMGRMMGQDYGLQLMQESSWIRDIDAIVPVPLHAKRQKIRGFNQSEAFAKGISEQTGISSISSLLKRSKLNDSQTKHSGSQRFENVRNLFNLQEKEQNKWVGKSILIVDDVITTGATAESCIKAVLSIPGIKVSFASIAYSPIV